MSNWLIIAGAAFLTLILITIRGDKKFKAKERIAEDVMRRENEKAEILGFLPYHGGFPQIPKPQKLNIALAHDGLLLFTNQGNRGKVDFSSCYNVEKFTTKKNPDLKGKSIVLWGPFMGLFMKPKFRYFIVVNYKDMGGIDNNILLEANSIREMENIFVKIFNGFKNNKIIMNCN